MARLPFDPKKVKKPSVGESARREKKRFVDATGQLSVSQLSELIKRAVNDHTPAPVSVVGEISNFIDRNHWYLSLKDEECVISCVMWASSAKKCGFVPEQGQQVVAKGRLDYYGPQGRLQFYIEKLTPVGQGALEIQFQKLCAELREKGYFEDSRKMRLPAFPTKIAVVTSETSAALQDVIKTAHQRWAGCQLYLVDARMQGAESAPQVAGAVRWLNEVAEGIGLDAIILTRGGGSLEDLWAFNEKVVADAIYDSALPVVAAIGHETDTTIAELVADMRCSTPTQAAMCLVPDRGEWDHRVSQAGQRLRQGLKGVHVEAKARLAEVARYDLFDRPGVFLEKYGRLVEEKCRMLGEGMKSRLRLERDRLMRYERTLGQVEPVSAMKLGRAHVDDVEGKLVRVLKYRVAGAKREVDEMGERLPVTMGRYVKLRGLGLESIEKQMRAISPRQVLNRGYGYLTTQDGKVIKSAKKVKVGDMMVAHLGDGRVHSQAVKTTDQCIIPEEGAPVVSKRSRKKKGDDGGPGLFG